MVFTNTSNKLITIIIITIVYLNINIISTRILAVEKETLINSKEINKKIINENLNKQSLEEFFNADKPTENNDKDLVEEWERLMGDYQEDILFTTMLFPDKPKFFYEEITESMVNNTIKGAFIIEGNRKEDNVKMIIFQDNNVINQLEGKQQVFSFKVNEPKVLVISLISKTQVKLTFTIGTGKSNLVTKDHIQYSDEKLDNLLTFLNNFKLEKKILGIKHNDRNKSKHIFPILSIIIFLLL